MFSRLLNFLQRKQIARLKRRYVLLIIFVVILLLFLIIVYSLNIGADEKITYGVTYSPKYATELELDWQEAFLASLNDLKVKNFRFMAYWDEIETIPGQYDFSQIDWLLEKTDAFGAKVIVVVGRRQPRWPECHQPEWVEDLSLVGQQAEELVMLKETVNHLKNIIALSPGRLITNHSYRYLASALRLIRNFINKS
jgi:hypothetical protein